MPFIGDVTRQVGYKRGTEGDHGFSGDVSALKKIMRNIAGILGDLSGSVSRLASFKRKPQGDISQSGITTRRTSLHRSVVGEFSSSGIVSRFVSYFRSTDGDLSWSGLVDLAYGPFKRAVAGVIGFTGDLTKKTNFPRQIIGGLDSSGDLKRKYAGSRKLTGSLSWSGVVDAIKSMPERLVAGVLSFSSTLIRRVNYSRKSEGDLTSSGTVKRKFSGFRKLVGSISWSGIVSILAGVAGIGIILDPAIKSITKLRAMISKTIDRDIEEK